MSSESAYFTFLGRSVWALLNTYYAVLREVGLRPRTVCVFGEELFVHQTDKVKEGLLILSGRYGFTPEIHFEILGTAMYSEACHRISEMVTGCRESGMGIAIDITPGRKVLVTGAIVSSLQEFDQIFYLSIDSLEDAARPYMMIPLQRQELKDLKVGMGRCGGVTG